MKQPTSSLAAISATLPTSSASTRAGESLPATARGAANVGAKQQGACQADDVFYGR